jgi:DNA-binding transcriptional MerR regulator
VTTHTIGEVLNQLKDEFADITISKIRFLETEGLISPDRTESGYRKFTDGDIDRLRYVLRAQRDRYLPLKVIKQELARIDAGDEGGDGVAAGPGGPGGGSGAASAGTAAGVDGPGAHVQDDSVGAVLARAATDETYDARELAQAAGVDAGAVGELRDHGLIGPGPTYDTDDLRVVTLAGRLIDDGLEARHLRMYRQFADREAAFTEQLVAPLLRQRNPDSRRLATERTERLAELGGGLHRALLLRQLRALLRS